MSVMMDIVFSSLLGGVITLLVMNANIVIKEAVATYNGEVMVQQMLITDAQIVESEFRNMGCGVPSVNEDKITEAKDSCMVFKMALRPEPTSPITTIKYYSGPKTELSWTDNPNDRYLYRQQGATAPQKVGIITRFNLKYYNFNNEIIDTPEPDSLGKIALVEVTLEVQSPFNSYIDQDGNKRYSSALWRQTRLASQNLKR
jgi:hypothetical protein